MAENTRQSYDVTAISGTCDIYFGAFGATEPDKTVLNPDPAKWFLAGTTEGGLDLGVATEWFKSKVDQVNTPINSRLTSQEVSFKFSLSSDRARTLQAALNAGIKTTDDDDIEPTGYLARDRQVYIAVLIQGEATDGGFDRFIGRRTLNVAAITYSFKKDGNRQVNFELLCHLVPGGAVGPWRKTHIAKSVVDAEEAAYEASLSA